MPMFDTPPPPAPPPAKKAPTTRSITVLLDAESLKNLATIEATISGPDRGKTSTALRLALATTAKSIRTTRAK